MNRIYNQLVIFYYVAHCKSFTKAAEQLQTSKGYVSKEIANLERSVGSALLHRSTRSLQLTAVGEELFVYATQIVEVFRQAESTLSSLQNKVEGILRITSPSAFADYMLAPNLPRFFKDYPGVRLEMNLTGNLLNLVEEKIDVAIRLTHEPPLDRVAKRLGEYQMIICASKKYLDENRGPKTPKELTTHPCLIYSTERHSTDWPFQIEGEAKSVRVNPTLTANAASVLLNAAIEGRGIARLPDYVVRAALQMGHLSQILTPFYPPPIPVYAIYAQSRRIPPKIYSFLGFLQEVLYKK